MVWVTGVGKKNKKITNFVFSRQNIVGTDTRTPFLIHGHPFLVSGHAPWPTLQYSSNNETLQYQYRCRLDVLLLSPSLSMWRTKLKSAFSCAIALFGRMPRSSISYPNFSRGVVRVTKKGVHVSIGKIKFIQRDLSTYFSLQIPWRRSALLPKRAWSMWRCLLTRLPMVHKMYSFESRR